MSERLVKSGFLLGCLTLALSFLVLVFGFAPFTPAVIALPIVLLLSGVVAWMGSRRLAIMSAYLCLGTLLTSAMTMAIIPVDEGNKLMFVLISTSVLAVYLLVDFTRSRG